ncbi:alpha/beta fold hydrolase [Microbacterium marinilacus]|uniref:Alpha/beta fold hydrolase n=1 Tax=Microbacterium marinilacus TaxID=415209 RepID=A0ABP7B5L5_9MICO|nr:alpha/beta hydrolase [Microbacterium marinilacus]MBY0689923.1 alpha/beta hydrolase [Microbacterium marinilacus]
MTSRAPHPVTLPRLCWGDAGAERRALLVHGLGSSGALMWRLAVALADAGWHATAVDLRGHGDAPRALDYSVEAYAADVVATLPDGGGAWDLVVAHSLGGAASTTAAAENGEWTRRLVLIDPAILVTGRDSGIIRRSQERAFDDNRIEAVRAEHPHWHPHDLELKVDAVARASRWAVEQTSAQNSEWDVRAAAARLRVPTHVIGADPKVYSLFTGALADEVLANPAVTMSIIAGAGHSPHRDEPEPTVRRLLEVIDR